MRISQITILCITSLFISCGASEVPPTDNEMIQHFYAHESAFNQIKELVSMRPNSSYYPPYHPNDTICLTEISIPTQKALDSLLVEIGCKRIFYAVKGVSPKTLWICYVNTRKCTIFAFKLKQSVQCLPIALYISYYESSFPKF